MPVRVVDASIGITFFIFAEMSCIVSIFSEILISRGEISVETIAEDGNCQTVPLNFEGTDHSGRAI
jgi:hypothetical protein